MTVGGKTRGRRLTRGLALFVGFSLAVPVPGIAQQLSRASAAADLDAARRHGEVIAYDCQPTASRIAVSHTSNPPEVFVTRPLALLFALAALIPQGASGQTAFVVRNVRVFHGERVSTDRSVFVRDGKIAQIGGTELAVPAGTETVDGSGRALLPGLIDAHVHLSDSVTADLR